MCLDILRLSGAPQLTRRSREFVEHIETSCTHRSELIVRTFIFLCDMTTEQECLDRSLFGTNAGENLQHHYSKVAVGDRLFLYNFETGGLRGPFTALTVCTHNLEPTAWKKTRRSFPWQVRVDGRGAAKKPLRADDFASFIPLASTKVGLLPPAELSEEQVTKLLAVVTE